MQSLPEICLSRKKGKNNKLAQARRIVATKKESTPARELPIMPNEKAQISETIAK